MRLIQIQTKYFGIRIDVHFGTIKTRWTKLPLALFENAYGSVGMPMPLRSSLPLLLTS